MDAQSIFLIVLYASVMVGAVASGLVAWKLRLGAIFEPETHRAVVVIARVMCWLFLTLLAAQMVSSVIGTIVMQLFMQG